MHLIVKFSFLFISLLFCLKASAEIKVTTKYSEIRKIAEEKIKKYGAKDLLIVLDIDNTTLTMPQQLGSDQWFGWQYRVCKRKEKECHVKDIEELMELQGKLFSISNMLPTEKDAVKMVSELQKKGVRFLFLTSRGPVYRDATERELRKNGYDNTKITIGPDKGYAGTYFPITKEGKKLNKKISFMNGLMMTSGLHKGDMLGSILKKTGSSFKSVVFVDDHEKHVKGMEKRFKDTGVDLVAFHYQGMKNFVNEFKSMDKKILINQYQTLKKTIDSIFK